MGQYLIKIYYERPLLMINEADLKCLKCNQFVEKPQEKNTIGEKTEQKIASTDLVHRTS